MLLGGVVLFDALRLGIGWGTDGPQSGFFPFWLAVLLIAMLRGHPRPGGCGAPDPAVRHPRAARAGAEACWWPAVAHGRGSCSGPASTWPSALYIGLLHALDRPPPLAGHGRPGRRRPGGHLPRLRAVVPGADAQGARSRPGWATERWGSTTSSSASRSRSPRSTCSWPCSASLLGTIIGVLPGLGGANGVAILLPLTFTMPPTSAIILLTSHLLGRPLRRGHHLGALQHPGRAVVGGHHLRRLPAGPAGAGRPGPHRRLHLVVRGRLLLDRADHVLRARSWRRSR